jgi:hypothetical protein
MPSDLFSNLSAKPQREVAGSDSASRFDYQKDWAFCRMIRKHIDGEDYLVAFEFHDDVVFLEPSGAPTIVEFCQVKTSSSASARTLGTLTARPKKKDSILKKMVSNFDGICAGHDIRVILVSNNAFNFSDKDICAKDLDQKYLTKLVEKLKDEIPGFDTARLEKLHFKVTGIPLEAMRSFLNGEAQDLFCEKFGEDHGLNIRTWIRLVQSEITRKNNYPSDQVGSPEGLIRKKCVGQPFVEATQATMNKQTSKSLDTVLVSNLLISAGWNQVDIMRLQKKIPQANTDFYDPTNSEVIALSDKIKTLINDSTGTAKELSDFLSNVSNLAEPATSSNPYLQQDYLMALGVLVYHEEI